MRQPPCLLDEGGQESGHWDPQSRRRRRRQSGPEWTRVDSSPSCATHQLCDLKQATVPLGLQFPIFIFIIF